MKESKAKAKQKKEDQIEEVKKGVNKVLIGAIILVILIGVYLLVVNLNENKDNKKFSKEYPTVTEENIFVYKTADEIIELLETGTGVIYMGFPECQWCQSYVVMLNDVAKEQGVKEIYYYNIREDRKENNEQYQKIVSLLDTYLLNDENGNPRVYVPEVVVVVDGNIMGHNNDTSVITDDITPDAYWTTEKKEELKNKLSNMFASLNICIDCND